MMTDLQLVDNSLLETHGKNYLIETCEYCKKIMILVEGSVIYGDKWYHQECWKIRKG